MVHSQQDLQLNECFVVAIVFIVNKCPENSTVYCTHTFLLCITSLNENTLCDFSLFLSGLVSHREKSLLHDYKPPMFHFPWS